MVSFIFPFSNPNFFSKDPLWLARSTDPSHDQFQARRLSSASCDSRTHSNARGWRKTTADRLAALEDTAKGESSRTHSHRHQPRTPKNMSQTMNNRADRTQVGQAVVRRRLDGLALCIWMWRPNGRDASDRAATFPYRRLFACAPQPRGRGTLPFLPRHLLFPRFSRFLPPSRTRSLSL